MFNIFTAAENDIPAIRQMAEKTWWLAYSNILSYDQIRYMLHTIYAPQTLKQQMKDNTEIFLIVRDEKGAQGFASYGQRPDDRSVFKIHKLYVLPRNQGNGFGKALISEIQNRLRRSGLHTLDLNVNRFNPAVKFYQKLGFKILREEDIPIGPFWMNDYVMRMKF
jgi:ribosomal protein S18 acetylase RimI-like enzyme